MAKGWRADGGGVLQLELHNIDRVIGKNIDCILGRILG
jgi:hypothetical protein